MNRAEITMRQLVTEWWADHDFMPTGVAVETKAPPVTPDQTHIEVNGTSVAITREWSWVSRTTGQVFTNTADAVRYAKSVYQQVHASGGSVALIAV